jgi:protein-disulfide isomerase
MHKRALAAASAIFAAALAILACTTPAKTAAATPKAGGHAVDCAGASLALPEDTVVGKLDGQPITLKDLGPDAKSAEQKALFEYCDAVFSSRQNALDNYVVEHLVDKAAKAAGKSTDDYMQAEVTKRIPQPSDDQIKAFYDSKKREGMPEFDKIDPQLRAQVVMVMNREKSEGAVKDILDGLKKGVAVEKSLPDVRSPPRDVEITAHTAIKGGKDAKVKVVEFADFQCPYCSRAAEAVRELNAKYGDKIEIAYRNFPLRQIHPFAQHAAEVGQCAQEQGKFWEMADKMYSDQEKLDEASLEDSAKAIGLDTAKFDDCLKSGRGASAVEEDVKKATDLGVEGTPTFFVNGRQHLGAPTLEGLSAAVDAELK